MLLSPQVLLKLEELYTIADLNRKVAFEMSSAGASGDANVCSKKIEELSQSNKELTKKLSELKSYIQFLQNS